MFSILTEWENIVALIIVATVLKSACNTITATTL